MSYKKLIIIITLSSFLISCKITQDDALHYKLTFIITDKINSDKNISFPNEIIVMCKPIDSLCGNDYFTPSNINIERLGENPFNKIFETHHKKNTNIKSHINSVDAYFTKGDGKIIGKELSIDNTSNTNFLANFLTNLGTKDKVFYFSQKPKNDSISSQKLYSDIYQLKYSISEYLCENKDHNIVIIFNPIENIITNYKKDNIKPPKETKKEFNYSKVIDKNQSKPTQENDLERPIAKYITTKNTLELNCLGKTSISWDEIEGYKYVITIKDYDSKEKVFGPTEKKENQFNVTNIGLTTDLKLYEIEIKPKSKNKNLKDIPSVSQTFSLIDKGTLINPSCCH